MKILISVLIKFPKGKIKKIRGIFTYFISKKLYYKIIQAFLLKICRFFQWIRMLQFVYTIIANNVRMNLI